MSLNPQCSVVPPHIFDHMANHASDPEHRELGRRGLTHHLELHAEREANSLEKPARIDSAAVSQCKIYSAGNKKHLPGTPERVEGHGASTDVVVKEADEGALSTLRFYQTVFGRNSVDGQGLTLISTVHYEHKLDNAFWNGKQMIYGDGDTTLFDRFTKHIDVIGHELTHGVTQYTAHLAYHNQSGALNESISDVFGSMVKQKMLNQTADTADWLIGDGLLIPKTGVNRTALRSLKAPGSAYNDPKTLGVDPQPANMAHYKHSPDTPHHDFGGVHTNSGIPNKAFYEAAIGFGGHSWEKAGKIWYSVLTGGSLSSTAGFADFRNLTVEAAHELLGASGKHIVTKAWASVGL